MDKILPRLNNRDTIDVEENAEGVFEIIGIQNKDKESFTKKMYEKFSELFNVIRSIQKGNVGFIEGFRQLFNRTSKEKTPEQLREQAEQQTKFDLIYDVLVDIREALFAGFLITKKSSPKGIIAGLKDWIFENPIISMALASSAGAAITSFFGGITGLLTGFMAGAGKVLAAAKFMTVAASVVTMVFDAVKAAFKADDWGVRDWYAAGSGLIGGTGSGWENAFYKGGQFAILGATWGLKKGGLKGLLIGGIIGGIFGAIAGYFGGESIAKLLQDIEDRGFLTVIGEAISDAVDRIKQYFIDLIDDLTPDFFNSSQESLSSANNAALGASGGSMPEQFDVFEQFRRDSSQQAMGLQSATMTNPQPQGSSTSDKDKPQEKKAASRGVQMTDKQLQKEANSAPFVKTILSGDKINNDNRNYSENNVSNQDNKKTENVIRMPEQFQDKAESMAQPASEQKNNGIDLKNLKITNVNNAQLLAIEEMENDAYVGYNAERQVFEPYNDVDKNRTLAIAHGHHWIPENLSDLDGDVSNKIIPLKKVEIGDTLTREQARKLLEYRYKGFSNQIANSKVSSKIDPSDNYSNFYSELPSAIKSTLSSMAFQMGMGTFNEFEGMRRSLKAYTETNDKQHLEDAAGHIKFVDGKSGTLTPLFQQTPKRAEAYQKSIRENKVYTLRYDPEKKERVPVAIPIPSAKGFIAKDPSVIMTGEYSGAGENPEVTIQMNALENRVLATTNKIIEMKRNQEEKNPVFLNSALESKTINTINTSRSSEERVMMKENMERRVVQMQMPVVNNVVDNTTVNNTNAPIIVRRSSKNQNNPFLVG